MQKRLADNNTEHRQLINNLRNVRPESTVYRYYLGEMIKGLGDEELIKLVEALPEIQLLLGDSFFLYFTIPFLRESNPNPFLDKALHAMREHLRSPEYQARHRLATFNAELSRLFAVHLARELLTRLKEEIEKKLEDMKNSPQTMQQLQQLLGLPQAQIAQMTGQQLLQQLLAMMPAPAQMTQPQQGQSGQQTQQGGAQGAQNQQTAPIQPNTQLPPQEASLCPRARAAQQLLRTAVQKINQRSLSNAMNAATRNAAKRTEVAKKLQDVLSGGVGKEAGTFELALELTSGDLRRVENIEEIISLANDIIRHLPRYRHVKHREVRRGGELYGIKLTGDPAEALITELALPDDLFYIKWAKKSLVGKRLAEKKREEGAYYVLIDNSGSMRGIKTKWARSVALALLKLARRRKADYFLRFFETETYPWPDKEPLSSPKELLEHILRISPSGGTDITAALEVALNDIKKHGLDKYTNTIIIITDGEDYVKPHIVDQFKKNKARLVAVMIYGENPTLRETAEKTGGQYIKVEPTEKGALKIIDALKEKRRNSVAS